MKKIWREIKWFFRQCKRTYGYAKKAWGGYDWDYRYSIDMFSYSLERLAKSLDSPDAFSERGSADAQRIRTIIKLMNKVYDEEYALEYQDKMKELYGEDIMDIEFVPYEDNPKEYYTIKHKYSGWNNEKEIEEMQSKLFLESHEKQEKAHRILWAMIEHRIRYWWD